MNQIQNVKSGGLSQTKGTTHAQSLFKVTLHETIFNDN